jgi:hypothetical protein
MWAELGLSLGEEIEFRNSAAASTTRTNLGLGETNSVTFGKVTTPLIASDISSTLSIDLFNGSLRAGTNAVFAWSAHDIFLGVDSTFLSNVTVSGNATLNGVGNTAPSQTASSGSSLMTRELSDARYSFSRWYSAADLLYLEDTSGFGTIIRGNDVGWSPLRASMVVVPDAATKYNLPIDYRVGGQVRVVSYWTDRVLTNSGGTNADIAVWAHPFAAQPTSNTGSNNLTQGTQIKTVYTANYGGTANSRYYVVDQLVDFGTITNISATNPMQLKLVELQRRGSDATDTSTNSIYLSGVHIYVP